MLFLFHILETFKGLATPTVVTCSFLLKTPPYHSFLCSEITFSFYPFSHFPHFYLLSSPSWLSNAYVAFSLLKQVSFYQVLC